MHQIKCHQSLISINLGVMCIKLIVHYNSHHSWLVFDGNGGKLVTLLKKNSCTVYATPVQVRIQNWTPRQCIIVFLRVSVQLSVKNASHKLTIMRQSLRDQFWILTQRNTIYDRLSPKGLSYEFLLEELINLIISSKKNVNTAQM